MPNTDKSKEQLIIENDALQDDINRLKIKNSLLINNFKNVVKKHVDGIIISDNSGIIKYINTAAENMFGYKKEKLVGETFGFPVIAGEFTEIDIISKNGLNGLGEVRTADIEWESEAAKLLSIREITKQKALEEDLRNKINELQRFHNITVDRELSMIALKKEINEMLKKSGNDEKYVIVS